MKQLLLFIFLMPVIAFSQSTTRQEYVYLSSGVIDQLSKGEDINKGYSIQELPQTVLGNCTVKGIEVYRADNSIVGTIIITKSTETLGSGVKYYAMPAISDNHKISYGWNDFMTAMSGMSGLQKNAVIDWLAFRVSYLDSKVKKS